MDRVAAFIRARLFYQYLFGALVWLILAGKIIVNQGIYESNGLLYGLDYLAFYSAGQLVLTGQSAELYDAEAGGVIQRQLYDANADSVMEFLNPPFFAVLLAPFAALPFVPSLLAWTAFSLALLCLGLLGLEGRLRASTLATVLCFFPIIFALRNGQNSLLTAGLLGLAYGCLRGQRPLLAGLTASLILYKPHLLLGVGLFGLVHLLLGLLDWLGLTQLRPNRLKMGLMLLLGLALGGAALLGLTWLFMPEALDQYREFTQTKLAHWTYGSQYYPVIQYTARGMVQTLLPGQRLLADGVQYLTWLVAAWALFVFCRRQPALPLQFAMAVAIGACIAPYTLLYDWAALIVPAILLWRYAPAHQGFWVLLCTAVWLAAYLGRPLTELQLRVLPVALHVPYLVLLGATIALWRYAVRIPESEETGSREPAPAIEPGP